MASVNRVIIIGRLGDDPVVHRGEKGVIANLSVATSESWKSKDGEKKEHTEWHKVVLYGQPAEFAEEHLKKGALIYVEGRLQTRKWEDKNGKERYTTEIVGERLKALGSKNLGSKKEGNDDIPY